MPTLGKSADPGATVLTPDDIMDGARPDGPVVVFDDDHFYMGGLVAEQLARDGCDVTLVTPASEVSSWTQNTLEQHRIQAQLMRLGVTIRTATNLTAIGSGHVELADIHIGETQTHATAATVLITMRQPIDDLYNELVGRLPGLSRIGDALGPSTIAAAVHSGHLLARNLGGPDAGSVPFRRELIDLAPPHEG